MLVHVNLTSLEPPAVRILNEVCSECFKCSSSTLGKKIIVRQISNCSIPLNRNGSKRQEYVETCNPQ